jgi:phenylalanyl-tRNA synthetase beta chain
VPGHRWYDVSREADLIEEVARRFGYDAFPAELRPFRPGTVPDDVLSALEDRLRTYFVGSGYDEARLSSFAGERGGDVALLNPLSSAEGRLRAQLVPGLLRQVEHNYAHQVRNVRLFEIGTVFAPGEPGAPPREATRIAAVFTGARAPAHWSGEGDRFDIWDLKGLAEEVAGVLGGAFALEPANEPGTPLAPGLSFRAVDASGALVGWGGEVDAKAIDAPAWADPVFALELTLRREYGEHPARRVAPLPAYPAVERDVALLVADEVPAARVAAVIGAAGGALLEAFEPFDLFRGRGIPGDARSIAYRLRFRAGDRTLTDTEVDQAMARILKQLKEELGVERRG